MNSKFAVGNLTIHRIVEQEEPFFDPLFFFPKLTPELLAENQSWMQPRYIDPKTGKLVLCIQSYLVQTPHHNILIDTCVGNHKPRPARPFWNMMNSDKYEKGLAATGVGVNDIDYVMCTHLHVDHTGWNTRLENGRWVPTFPNARYVFSREDYEHYLAIDQDPEKAPANLGSFRDSVLPVVEAGLAQMVSGAVALDEHLAVEPAPGHTPGSIAIKFESRGERALFCGDSLHHALQV